MASDRAQPEVRNPLRHYQARNALAFLMLVGGVAACAGLRADPPIELPDGHRRLEADVTPRRYAIDLEIDPAEGSFRGSVQIDIELARETRAIALHAEGLEIDQAYAVVREKRIPLSVHVGTNGGIALESSSPLAAGRASLRLRWEGSLGEVPRGLYRVNDPVPGGGGARWYAFTQFEPLSARRAFPCFDQPEFKTPFDVTLRVPAGLIALSNGPEVSRERREEQEIFRFARTQPLPSYLVAFAVGDFEMTEVPGTGVPTRIITTRGKSRLAAFAARRTPVILDWLERYFGDSYPFAKLDLIGVPNFSAGAMENVGLITFRESILLLDDRAAVWDRARAEGVIAHELAHMWYGNLVTMPWWDDLWLNEGFASWMGSKAVDELVPSYELRLRSVAHAQHIMDLDSKRDARAVRQPIRSAGDVYNAFDGITYGKGAALLRMLEAWLGEDVFRDGVRRYLRAHAYGSGATTDLLASLEAASGQPVGETIRAFLDQPGVPLVEVVMTCEEGRPPELDLLQRRYLPAGSTAAQGEVWSIPFCVRYAVAGSPEPIRECFRADEALAVKSLDRVGCPSWLHPNAEEAGYYRWSVEPSRLADLIGDGRRDLTLAERVALPGHLWALLVAEKLSVSDYANGLVELSEETHRSLVAGVAGGLSRLHHAAVDDAMTPVFAAEVRSLLRPHLERIGLMPADGESVDAELLRASLLSRLADFGQDAQIREAASGVARRFVADPTAVAPARVDLFLSIAAERGDATLWQGLEQVLRQPPTPAIRSSVIHALGSFREPALLESSLDLLLDGTLRSQDFRTLLAGVGDESRAVAWEWLQLHYAALLPTLGPMSAPRLPSLTAGFCTEERAAEVEAFFDLADMAAAAPDGTARNLNLALESIARCVRLRAAIREPFRVWLAAAPSERAGANASALPERERATRLEVAPPGSPDLPRRSAANFLR